MVLPEVSTTIETQVCDGEDFEGYDQSGIYVDTLIANNGCDSIRTIDLTVLSEITITDTLIVNENGNNNGAITIQLAGGLFPYEFEWSNGANEQNISNLVAGTYGLTVTDSEGCLYEFSFIVDLETSLKYLETGDILLFPNPNKAGEQVSLNFSKNIFPELKLSIVNVLGEIIFSEEVFAPSNGIYNFETPVDSGLYYILLETSEKRIKFFKLILL